MSQEGLFHPPAEFVKNAHISSYEAYKEMYDRSIKDPDGFWSEIAEKNFYWKEKWNKVREYDFKGGISIKWFAGAKTNITYNCLDRHLETRGDQTAIIWEGNEPGEDCQAHLQRAPRRGLQVRQRAEELRREEGRPRFDLHAHGQGTGDRDARPVPASARSTRSSSAASAPTRSPTVSLTRPASSWSRPTA